MSQGAACKCPESKKPAAQRHWVVLQRNSRCSAFDGYRSMFSAYSAVQCHECGAVWRTKADYVHTLVDGKNLYDSGGTWQRRPDGTTYRTDIPPKTSELT